MMTIGRHYVGPRRNWIDTCDYCAVDWPRDQLVVDDNGYLACPDDRDGRVEKALDRLRAAGMGNVTPVRGKSREY